MRLKRSLALLPLLAAGLAGCYKNNTPTAATTLNVVITSSLANTTGLPTLLEAQLVFDAMPVVDNATTTGISSMPLNASGATISGSHTLTFLIIKQTTTPNNYSAVNPDVKVYDATGNFVRDLQLTTMTGSLATDQSLTYSFTL